MSPRATRSRWGDRVTAASLGLWGAVHVLGGGTLATMTATEGLATLGPNAATVAPSQPGQAAAALLHFHGFNIAVAGIVVLVLAVTWLRGGAAWQLGVALGLAFVLDIGLVLYLLGPGLMPVAEGLPGPILLLLALVPLATSQLRRTEAPSPSRMSSSPASNSSPKSYPG